ncbi:SDR family oxidoreductase [Enterococcus raffinosus]|uniref:SDR family NAD(P)-dependent oxidoreductase n=1 Tax=Enterococcus raffinosus TaxID=71452 RepID=UPI001C106FE1|nr:SDR family oxidoreductase [Enterococcus raffinosus]MBU5360854.1 SDR family oxidoreductase [Enterococcus raffinosus]
MSSLKKMKNLFLSMRQKQKIPIIKESTKDDLLKGRTAIITGGTGAIGQAIASAFIESGATVYLIGRNTDKLKKESARLGNSCHYFQMDITNIKIMEEQIPKLLKISNYKIDILVNSAGLLTREQFGHVSEKTWDDVIDTNLKGTFFLSQMVSNVWIEKGIKGNILNISSGSGLKPGWTPYQISKRALDSATVGMAQFLISYGIVVNSIAPGPVFSSMQGLSESDSMESIDNPTGRLITPIEIGEWAVYMVSSIGQYAVGTNVHLTGGNGIFQFEDR